MSGEEQSSRGVTLLGGAAGLAALCCFAGPAILGAVAGATVGSTLGIAAAVVAAAVAVAVALLLRQRLASFTRILFRRPVRVRRWI